MKYGKICTYKDLEEAINLLEKEVVFSDSLRQITEFPETCVRAKLKEIVDEGDVEQEAFFLNSEDEFNYQFIREIEDCEEKPTLMTHSQLSEWLAKGNGERKFVNDDIVCREWFYMEKEKNLSVEENVCIRPWGSDEWVVPTVGIYERDCKSYCRTTLA